MCGILAEFSLGSTTDPQEFKRLLRLSTKRGPDHSGYWGNGDSVQLGFNRLAILELSETGNQPMVSPGGRFVVAFNGEIYNHLELRKELALQDFKGHSDTETIAACFDEWGIEKLVDRLDGMFAMVVFDRETNVITLVRDFAGIKPLFYGWNGTTLVAASQYDQVVNHPSFVNEPINAEVLRLYLQQHFLPAPFGLKRNTFQVEPGQIVKLSNTGVLEKKKYWSFPDYVQPDFTEHSHAIEAIDEALRTSVRYELLSDVPVGAFLSGGVDSPLISYYSLQYKRPFKTFTIGSDSLVHDETALAEDYAKLLGSDHISCKMSDVVGNDILGEVLNCIHEPMADFSLLPTYVVSKLAKQKVTVALSGDGGDELFFGYERFWSIAKNIRYQRCPWIVKAGAYKLDRWLTGNKNVNGVALFATQAAAHQRLHSRFADERIDELFPSLKGVALPDSYSNYSYAVTNSEADLIQAMRKAEFYGMMQKTLRKVDLASMENSLEVRVPFLKKSFIEASLAVDPMLSYGPYRKKQLLKDLLKSKVPQSPIDNVKRGFSIPLGDWMRKEMRNEVRDRLNNRHFLSSYNIKPNKVDKLLTDHDNGTDLKWPIFTLLALSAWHQKVSV